VISLTTSDPIILVGLYLDPPDRALVLCCDENTKEAVAMNEGFRRQVLDLYRHRAGEGRVASMKKDTGDQNKWQYVASTKRTPSLFTNAWRAR
jgi:hypothetical protein